jgi:hypothetical protein
MYNNNNNSNNNNKEKLKYKSLYIEIQSMWNLKCKFILVTIEATRIVTKVLRKNLEAIPGRSSVDHYRRQLY